LPSTTDSAFPFARLEKLLLHFVVETCDEHSPVVVLACYYLWSRSSRNFTILICFPSSATPIASVSFQSNQVFPGIQRKTISENFIRTLSDGEWGIQARKAVRLLRGDVVTPTTSTFDRHFENLPRRISAEGIQMMCVRSHAMRNVGNVNPGGNSCEYSWLRRWSFISPLLFDTKQRRGRTCANRGADLTVGAAQ